ncbi:hypothetical protein M758_3G080500 [Ceratodon purpureus]|nr:hypothetical protein M758_3G080100 [Ceratodon purpureus]KAG0622212.1 hypothetical protein M758_3G080500 [Ceratodon purpureus]
MTNRESSTVFYTQIAWSLSKSRSPIKLRPSKLRFCVLWKSPTDEDMTEPFSASQVRHQSASSRLSGEDQLLNMVRTMHISTVPASVPTTFERPITTSLENHPST